MVELWGYLHRSNPTDWRRRPTNLPTSSMPYHPMAPWQVVQGRYRALSLNNDELTLGNNEQGSTHTTFSYFEKSHLALLGSNRLGIFCSPSQRIRISLLLLWMHFFDTQRECWCHLVASRWYPAIKKILPFNHVMTYSVTLPADSFRCWDDQSSTKIKLIANETANERRTDLHQGMRGK